MNQTIQEQHSGESQILKQHLSDVQINLPTTPAGREVFWNQLRALSNQRAAKKRGEPIITSNHTGLLN